MKKLMLAVLVATVSFAAHAQSQPAATAKVDYDNDVKPILAQNCYGCHGPEVQQSGLRLDLRQNALRGGDYGPVINPGKGAESKLIRRLINGDGGLQMPPSGPLTTEEIGTLRAWIDQGAEFRTEIAEAPQKPVTPRLAAVITLARSASSAQIAAAITRDPELVKARDLAASTLLHHAAGFGALETLTVLIDAGADVNAKNQRGSTPLHWAIDNEAKVRLLLARGAALNAKQVEGRTPLFLAASLAGGHAALRLLLERGADPNIATATGQTPLMAAAIRGDLEAVRMLVEAKADVSAKNGAGETALILSSGDGNPQIVRLLLDRGADPRVRTKRGESALGDAATAGNEETVRLLLEHGAEVNVRNIRGFSPLMLAASSDALPAKVVKLLLAKGADPSYTADYDEDARDLAAKRGDTEVTRLLGGLRADEHPPATMPSHATVPTRAAIPQRVETALRLVENQSMNFIRIAGCNSCHSQDLASAANGFARSRGINAPREIAQLPASMMPPPERLMDLSIVAVSGLGWELFDAGMNGVAKNAYTDAAVRIIRAAQTPAGNWSANESRRPPMNAGEFSAAALSIYALKHYTPAGQEGLSDQTIAKAIVWLEQAKPETTQDRAFHALALAWAGRAESARTAARALLALQRRAGGWGQMATLDADSYATGQALYALSVAGKMSANDAAFQRGLDYLLRTQAADGSWRVKSRSIWLQPYFESGFPYGQDQFISTAGTSWAALALSTAVQPASPTTARTR